MLNWGTKKRIPGHELTTLFMQAMSGQEEPKEKIFAFLWSRLLVLARYRVREAAEDTVQETLVIVHTRFSEFQTLEGLLAFTNQVLRNKIGNLYQQRDRHKYTELDGKELRYRIEHDLEGAELDRIVQESIQKLSESHSECGKILSALYNGLEPIDISIKLNMPKSRLKVRTFRCRETLRRLLATDYKLYL